MGFETKEENTEYLILPLTSDLDGVQVPIVLKGGQKVTVNINGVLNETFEIPQGKILRFITTEITGVFEDG